MYRIVHNEQTGAYRVEKRGFLGWNFVMDQQSGDYLQFDRLESARGWVSKSAHRSGNTARRWKVVSDCND